MDTMQDYIAGVIGAIQPGFSELFPVMTSPNGDVDQVMITATWEGFDLFWQHSDPAGTMTLYRDLDTSGIIEVLDTEQIIVSF